MNNAETNQQVKAVIDTDADAIQGAVPGGRAVAKAIARPMGFAMPAGEPGTWLAGGMLVVCLALMIALVALITTFGLMAFWPNRIDMLNLDNGEIRFGVATRIPSHEQPSSRFGGERRSVMRFRSGGINLAPPVSSIQSQTDASNEYESFGNQELGRGAIGHPRDLTLVERIIGQRVYGIPIRIVRDAVLDNATQLDLEQVQAISGHLHGLLETNVGDALFQFNVQLAVEELRRSHELLYNRSARTTFDPSDSPSRSHVVVRVRNAPDWQYIDDVSEHSIIVQARTTLRFDVDSQRDLTTSEPMQQALQFELAVLKSRLRSFKATAQIEQAVMDDIDRLIHDALLIETQIERLPEVLATFEAASSKIPELKEASDLEELVANSLGPQASQALLASLQGIEQQLAENTSRRWTLDHDLHSERLKKYETGIRGLLRERLSIEAEIRLQRKLHGHRYLTVAVAQSPQYLGTLTGIDLQSSSSDSVKRSILAQVRGFIEPEIEHEAISTDSQVQLDYEPVSAFSSLITARDNERQSLRVFAISTDSYLDSKDELDRRLYALSTIEIPIEDIVRIVPANQITLDCSLSVYLSRWNEFFSGNLRESDTSGGVFSILLGTAVLTLIMTVAVVPFGVMAALYLSEYTTSGPMISLIRISINNLAGVPSIVYGAIGFSFLCLQLGGFIDGGPKNIDVVPFGETAWIALVTTAAFTFVGALIATALFGRSRQFSTRREWIGRAAILFWIVSLLLLAALLIRNPFFSGFYGNQLPTPTFGKGCILWAASTMALLTLPVVIVATEEALSTVPKTIREGSLACGASKWQTIRLVVLPVAVPGIITATILAIARGVATVAPLIVLGAVGSTSKMPLDADFPYLHGSRTFGHLAHQIYAFGADRATAESSMPLAFACALLLILLVASLNLCATLLRSRLRMRFPQSPF